MKLKSSVGRNIRKLGEIVLKLLPALSYVPPFLILYTLDPSSFNYTWKGRTYYMFFMWTVFLETILHWDNLKVESWKEKPRKAAVFLAALSLPTIYVLAANFISFNQYQNLNQFIMELSRKRGMRDEWFIGKMPLAIEYLILTVIFDFILLLGYGMSGVAKYSTSSFLLGLVGFIYLIDNLFPYGLFMPLQLLVPLTAFLAANVLNLIGYKTTIAVESSPIYGLIPSLKVEGLKNPDGTPYPSGVGIAWPCAGVDSLLIYSITILTFLKGGEFSRKQKVFFFIIGAVVTYFLNILRIVTIFIIGTVYGVRSSEWGRFHDYYGPLYSITWIVTYPLIIIAINSLWKKIRERFRRKQNSNVYGADGEISSA